jgi:dipeptidase E
MVFNACDPFEDRLRVYEREAEDLRGLDLAPEELDLRRYFDQPESLRSRLAALDVVWVVGGNAFVLARAMTATRFALAARELVGSGTLVYAGYSAGACVAGPDLEGIALMDEPDALPSGYQASMPPTTLGWVPWRIVPHWRSDHPEAPGAERAAEHLKARGLAYRALRDGEVIVVDGEGH